MLHVNEERKKEKQKEVRICVPKAAGHRPKIKYWIDSMEQILTAIWARIALSVSFIIERSPLRLINLWIWLEDQNAQENRLAEAV